MSAINRPDGSSGKKLWHDIVPSSVQRSAEDRTIVFTGVGTIIREDYAPISNFLLYVILPDDTVIVTMRRLISKTYDTKADVKMFSCKLGQGVILAFEK